MNLKWLELGHVLLLRLIWVRVRVHIHVYCLLGCLRYLPIGSAMFLPIGSAMSIGHVLLSTWLFELEMVRVRPCLCYLPIVSSMSRAYWAVYITCLLGQLRFCLLGRLCL